MFPFQTHSPKPTRKLIMNKLKIIDSPSLNFDERKRPIRYIILHYTGMKSGEAALKILTDNNPIFEGYKEEIYLSEGKAPPTKMSRVSSHYLIMENGDIHRLVGEDKRAWHAGTGNYGGETDMNSASIGIEIVNGGHDYGLPEFPVAQIKSVIELVKDIKERNGLDKQHVIGHSDYAPQRKLDPGEKFPWNILEDEGISLKIPKLKSDNDFTILQSPESYESQEISKIQQKLLNIGYYSPLDGIYNDVFINLIKAFQRHYRQGKVDGIIDTDTYGKIIALSEIVKPS